MSTSKSRSSGILFWKNLGLVLLITCIPMIFIGLILYYTGTNRIGLEVTLGINEECGRVALYLASEELAYVTELL